MNLLCSDNVSFHIEFYVITKWICHRSIGSTLSSSTLLPLQLVLCFVETIPSIIQNVEYSELSKNQLSLRDGDLPVARERKGRGEGRGQRRRRCGD